MTAIGSQSEEGIEDERHVELRSYSPCRVSAISDRDVKRLQLEGIEVSTGQRVRLWLYFEGVPAIYATNQSIGMAASIGGPATGAAIGAAETDGIAAAPRSARYWVYLDPDEFEVTCRLLERGEILGISCRHRCFPGAAETSRLVTAVRFKLVEGPFPGRQGASDHPIPAVMERRFGVRRRPAWL